MSTETTEEPQISRENLIEEAAKFLMNPKVAQHADEQKSAFLRKKGLTEDEIQVAFAKAKANMPAVASTAGPVAQYVSPVGPPVPSYPLVPPPTMWIRIRDICNFVLIITGASYGAYHIYKNYIGPLLTGRKQKSVEESMIELQQSVVCVLKEVQTTLSSLEKTLSIQSARIQALSDKEEKNHPSLHQLEELKTEITSLKGLLINRRTFPSTPSMSPSIPSWQLTKTAEKAVENTAITSSTLPTQQDETVKLEEVETSAEKVDSELVSDGGSGESGVDVIDANEEDSPPSSARENMLSVGESFSLAESLGDSSDELSP
ncbi:peroxisomal membrane protein PEX14 isoform X1 [Macrobrachium rosenbergii]|uniref:peroxisomal membrane protein PEX14 isoform X1 n=1 Tax=Macrobrachium rosenbergii TaxID=79674 RepID=UPI0034D4AC0A